jgi:hypothetical protein
VHSTYDSTALHSALCTSTYIHQRLIHLLSAHSSPRPAVAVIRISSSIASLCSRYRTSIHASFHLLFTDINPRPRASLLLLGSLSLSPPSLHSLSDLLLCLFACLHSHAHVRHRRPRSAIAIDTSSIHRIIEVLNVKHMAQSRATRASPQ